MPEQMTLGGASGDPRLRKLAGRLARVDAACQDAAARLPAITREVEEILAELRSIAGEVSSGESMRSGVTGSPPGSGLGGLGSSPSSAAGPARPTLEFSSPSVKMTARTFPLVLASTVWTAAMLSRRGSWWFAPLAVSARSIWW